MDADEEQYGRQVRKVLYCKVCIGVCMCQRKTGERKIDKTKMERFGKK